MGDPCDDPPIHTGWTRPDSHKPAGKMLYCYILPVLFTRVFADNLVGLGFSSVSYIKPILTHEKLFAVGKSGPNATFNLIFLGLGWPWVGEFVGFL